MRKYYQATLAVIAVVSFVSLLFYRHEYHRLRYVLEVFNYFGKPGQKSTENNCTLPVVVKDNIIFEESSSSWQRLNNDFYVYSAYNLPGKSVQVIAYGKSSVAINLQCAIFAEDDVSPKIGHFSYVTLIDILHSSNSVWSSEYKGFYLNCGYEMNKAPVAVTFRTKSTDSFNIILSVKTVSQSASQTGIAVCVTPQSPKSTSWLGISDMIGFINFHHVIGIDNFIVYDFGIPSTLNRYMRELSKNQFTYTLIPWNFPFPKNDHAAARDIIEIDCLHRTYGKVEYVVSLSWEEYIVLKYHRLFIDMMKDYNRSRLTASRYKLKTFTFCTQQPDDKHYVNSTYRFFKKTFFNENIIEKRDIYIHKHPKTIKNGNVHVQQIGNSIATINQYKLCENTDLSQETRYYDSSVSRFLEDIQNSAMYRKLFLEKSVLQH